MRTSMSAMGSLMLMHALLPARLDDAGHFALERQVAQLVAAQSELAVDPARAPGQRTTVAQPDRRGVARQLLQLGARGFLVLVRDARIVDQLQQSGTLRLELLDGAAALLVTELESELGHAVPLLLERETESGEQRARLVVRLRRGGDSDVHAPERVDLVVVDLREDDLFLEAQVVIAAAVE